MEKTKADELGTEQVDGRVNCLAIELDDGQVVLKVAWLES